MFSADLFVYDYTNSQLFTFMLIFNHIVDEVGNMIKDYTRNTNLWSTFFVYNLTKD